MNFLNIEKNIYIFFFLPIFQVFFAFHAISNIKKKMWCKKKKKSGGGVDFLFFLENQFFLISRFMLFSTLKKNIEKCPFTYWLNGRWFLQIVEKKNPGGRGRVWIFLNQFFLISRFMLFSTLKKNIEKCPFTYWLNGRWFLQIVERDSWDLYPLSSIPLF